MRPPTPSSSSRSNHTVATSASIEGGPIINRKAMTENNNTNGKESRFGFGRSLKGRNAFADTATAKKKKASLLGGSLKKLPNILTNKYPKVKIVKDSVPFLDEELGVLTQEAPFMKGHSPSETMCFLDRKEVKVGELLGQGQFASVYNVTGLSLLRMEEDNLTESLTQLSQEDLIKRETFVHDFNACRQHQTQSKARSSRSVTANNNHAHHAEKQCHQYALKHLKRELLTTSSARRRRDHNARGSSAGDGAGDTDLPIDQQFQLAAADLIVEALYLSRLQHPHVISIRGMAASGASSFSNGRYDSYFLILDKLSESLHERIRHWKHTNGQPRESQLQLKTYYAYQMAAALEYLHEHRIIFRDLKPSNIGFKEEDELQILQLFDFGLCRELPAAERLGDLNEVHFMTQAGTHRYMAVEILMGDKYNEKADTYSFGMVFYELLAQEPPFVNFAEEDHDMLVCERQHRPNHFFGCVIPQSIQKLLDESWAHEIPNRLTMAQVVFRLKEILANTFQQTLVEGPCGVKVLMEKGEEKKIEETAPTKQMTAGE